MTPAKMSCGHDFRSRTHPAFGAAAGLPRPPWGLAGRGANPEHGQCSDRTGSASRHPLHPRRQGIPDQHSGIDPAHGDRFRRCRHGIHPGRIDDGSQPGRGLVLQSAADGDLSSAEGGVDADNHALARRRRTRENTGDLSRRQPSRDLSQLPGRKSGRGKDAVVGGCHGAVGNTADDPDCIAGGTAGNSHRLPHRTGVGADHHGYQRDDSAAVRRRKYPVQFARYGSVRHRLCDDHHHRCNGHRPRCRLRKVASSARKMVRAGLRHSIEFRMNPRAVTSDVLLGIAPIALLIAVWQAITSFGYAPATLLPPPGVVLMRLTQQLTDTTFQHEIAATLFRLFAGFSIAVILGVTIGLVAAAIPAINAVVRPIVRVLAPLPKVALYPALLLLLGFGHESKITLVAADALFPILLSTYYGASMVAQKLIWSAMAAGTPRRQILFKVVLPAAAPSILTGCRIGLVISCIVVFLAEMITSTDGLGHMLVTAARTFQAVDMFVPLITISLLGLILNGLLQGLRSYLLRGFPEV